MLTLSLLKRRRACQTGIDAADAADAARQAFRDSFRLSCRTRLRARLSGDVCDVSECPDLSAVLAPLHAAVAEKVA